MWLRPSLFLLTVIFAQSGLAAECIRPPDLDGQIKAKPSADAYNALGGWFAEHRQPACAVSAFTEAARLDPASFPSHFNLGLALLQFNQPGRAVSALRVAVKLKPSDAPAHGALGVALQESGQLDEAESQLEAALAIDSQSAYLLDHLAQAYAAQRRFAADGSEGRDDLSRDAGRNGARASGAADASTR